MTLERLFSLTDNLIRGASTSDTTPRTTKTCLAHAPQYLGLVGLPQHAFDLWEEVFERIPKLVTTFR